MPAQQIIQFGGPSVNAVTTTAVPTIQVPYSTGTLCPEILFLSVQNYCETLFTEHSPSLVHSLFEIKII